MVRIRLAFIGIQLGCGIPADAMDAHNRAEGTVLEPANQQFAIARAGNITTVEPADVSIPDGNPAHGDIQTTGNLAVQGIPG